MEKVFDPDTAAGRLRQVAYDALLRHRDADELPTSVRFLFYELEQLGHLSKVRTGARRPEQNLTDAVFYLRENGHMPWEWIVDDTRILSEWRSAPSVYEYLDESVDSARINPWVRTAQPVIITESRTIAGVFSRGIAYRYLVPVAATNGQAGGFLVTAVAPLLTDDNTRVLYVGDLDLAGSAIEANTRSVLERHTFRTFTKCTWERIAITETQAQALRRRGVEPIRKTDRRYTDGRPHEAYEAETLGQTQVTALLRARLDALLPDPIMDVLEREQDERVRVRVLLTRGKRR